MNYRDKIEKAYIAMVSHSAVPHVVHLSKKHAEKVIDEYFSEDKLPLRCKIEDSTIYGEKQIRFSTPADPVLEERELYIPLRVALQTIALVDQEGMSDDLVMRVAEALDRALRALPTAVGPYAGQVNYPVPDNLKRYSVKEEKEC